MASEADILKALENLYGPGGAPLAGAVSGIVVSGGKAFVTLTGEVAAVQSAVDAGGAVCAERGLLVNKVVIPNPRKELLKELI